MTDSNSPLIKHTPYLWQRGGNYLVWCLGCGHGHRYPVDRSQSPSWGFNGNYEKPSFTPSMHIYIPAGENRPQQTICHFFVTDGQILYCQDCRHELKGQTLPLAPIPDNYGF